MRTNSAQQHAWFNNIQRGHRIYNVSPASFTSTIHTVSKHSIVDRHMLTLYVVHHSAYRMCRVHCIIPGVMCTSHTVSFTAWYAPCEQPHSQDHIHRVSRVTHVSRGGLTCSRRGWYFRFGQSERCFVGSASQFAFTIFVSKILLRELADRRDLLLAERYYSERYCRERYCRKRYCRERYCREILLREIYCRETLLREQDDGIHQRGTGEEHSWLDVRPDWSPGLTHCLQHQHRLS